jgi:REP element-mobilizing transposase RayT
MRPFWRMNRYWLLTSTFYGNWLPGAPKGFVTRVREERPDDQPSQVRREHDEPGTPYDREFAGLHRHAKGLLKCEAIRITLAQAEALLDQFQETARHRGWELRAVAIPRNHVHLVVGVPGDPDPTKMLGDFKAYGSRRLNRGWGNPASGTWWTYDGSKRKIANAEHLDRAIEYVRGQKFPLVVWIADDAEEERSPFQASASPVALRRAYA